MKIVASVLLIFNVGVGADLKVRPYDVLPYDVRPYDVRAHEAIGADVGADLEVGPYYAMNAQALAVPAGNAENGKAVFMKAKCFSCHGTMGQGGPGGRLAPKPVPFPAFRTFVRQGKVNSPGVNRNWAGMPPFSTKFISDAELADVYAYLSSIPEPPAPASIPLLAQP